jgi:3-dehydroquinate synthase
LTYSDKKTRSGVRSFVLPTSIGATEIVRDVTDAELIAATESMLMLMRQSITAPAAKKRKP